MASADLLAGLPAARRRHRALLATVAVGAAVLLAARLLPLPDSFGGRQQPVARDLPVLPVAKAPLDTPPHAAPREAPEQEPPTRAPSSRPLAEWLADIAASAGRGLVVAPDVTGTATATFNESSGWRERLDALARVHGFELTVSERLIEARSAHAGRAPAGNGDTFSADAAHEPAADDDDSSRSTTPAAAVAPQEPEATARVLRPRHARASDLVAALSRAARSADVEAAADVSSNAVVLAGPEPGVERVAGLVHGLDVPRRRFVLEAEIVELSRSVREELGVRWSVEGTVGGIGDFPAADAEGEGAGIIVATDGAHALRARIGALEAEGRVRVVSRPRVVVLEGRPASIESVRILRVRFPDRTAVVGDVDDAGVLAGGRAVEEIPVGVTLEVEPSMQGDGRIVLRIRAKSSTLGPPQPPDGIPEELSRKIDAEVAIGDGETAVLGGLLREGRSRASAGVPVLRSIPGIGLLFGKREHEREGEELAVLVTPHLLP